MKKKIKELLVAREAKYNDPVYFQEDPIAFPTRFANAYKDGACTLQDVEIAAVFAAHFAWGRRSMIVRDCERLFEEMDWRPFEYVRNGEYRDEYVSVHRTITWAEVAGICRRLKDWYFWHKSLEELSVPEMRVTIFNRKDDPKAANKKINMMRRWMVRDDGKVDLGIWKKTDAKDLVIPLDVHVYDEAVELGLTKRRSKDVTTALEITDSFREIWPEDPCRGDFALFGYGIDKE